MAEKKTNISFRLENDIIEKLSKAAIEDGRTRTSMITLILRKYFSKAGKKKIR